MGYGSDFLTEEPFELNKVTKEITNIVQHQSRGKRVKIRVSYNSKELKKANFFGDVVKYQ